MAESAQGGGACAVCAEAALLLLALLKTAQGLEGKYALLLRRPAVLCVETSSCVVSPPEGGTEALGGLVAMTAWLLGGPAVLCVEASCASVGPPEGGAEALGESVAMTAQSCKASRHECKLYVGAGWMREMGDWIQLAFCAAA
jgi:hypothetical protein